MVGRLHFIRLKQWGRAVYLERSLCGTLFRAKGKHSRLGWLPRAKLRAKIRQLEGET